MLSITARCAAFPQLHYQRLNISQIWYHHTAAGHSMDKASHPATAQQALLTSVSSGKGRIGEPWCQGILYSRLTLPY